MKRSKTVLSLLLAFSILLSGGYSAHSAAAPVSKTDKEVFAEECDRLYWAGRPAGKTAPDREHMEEICTAIAMYTAGAGENLAELIHGGEADSPNVTLAELERYLNANGMYLYREEMAVLTPFALVGTIDANSLLTVYSPLTSEWIVSGGACWKDESLVKREYWMSLWSPGVGQTSRCGLFDCVGLKLFNNKAEKAFCQNQSMGYVHDGYGNGMVLYNPCNGDPTQGVFFQYQDSFTTLLLGLPGNYMGYGFSALAVYSSEFSQYRGSAFVYYDHA